MSTFPSVQCYFVPQFSPQQLRFDQVNKTDSFSTEMLTNLSYSLTCVSVLQENFRKQKRTPDISAKTLPLKNMESKLGAFSILSIKSFLSSL